MIQQDVHTKHLVKDEDLSTVMEGQNAKVRELTKRRDEAISKYGEESKQVANLNTDKQCYRKI